VKLQATKTIPVFVCSRIDHVTYVGIHGLRHSREEWQSFALTVHRKHLKEADLPEYGRDIYSIEEVSKPL